MGHPIKFTDARLKAALAKHDGMPSLTGKALGISRQAVQQRVERNPELQQFIRDISSTTPASSAPISWHPGTPGHRLQRRRAISPMLCAGYSGGHLRRNTLRSIPPQA
jgi:hypothetical protein